MNCEEERCLNYIGIDAFSSEAKSDTEIKMDEMDADDDFDLSSEDEAVSLQFFFLSPVVLKCGIVFIRCSYFWRTCY